MNALDQQLLRELLTASRAAIDALRGHFEESACVVDRLERAIFNFEIKSKLFAVDRGSQVQGIVGDLDSM